MLPPSSPCPKHPRALAPGYSPWALCCLQDPPLLLKAEKLKLKLTGSGKFSVACSAWWLIIPVACGQETIVFNLQLHFWATCGGGAMVPGLQAAPALAWGGGQPGASVPLLSRGEVPVWGGEAVFSQPVLVFPVAALSQAPLCCLGSYLLWSGGLGGRVARSVFGASSNCEGDKLLGVCTAHTWEQPTCFPSGCSPALFPCFFLLPTALQLCGARMQGKKLCVGSAGCGGDAARGCS